MDRHYASPSVISSLYRVLSSGVIQSGRDPNHLHLVPRLTLLGVVPPLLHTFSRSAAYLRISKSCTFLYLLGNAVYVEEHEFVLRQRNIAQSGNKLTFVLALKLSSSGHGVVSE
jgi:hypothetical protein